MRTPAEGGGAGIGRAASPPLTAREIDALQQALDAVPAPLEPLDVVMLDGFLCGVLLQPDPVPAARWVPRVTDVDGRALPAGFDATRLQALLRRRHAELDRAIQGRRWFDPWVFELEAPTAGAAPGGGARAGAAEDHAVASGENADPDNADADAAAATEAVYPWVAGFVTALETFPGLLARDDEALTEPLALLYRHLDPDDLEDADALLEAIEQMGPPDDLADAVEGLVRAVLLLADVTRPLAGRPR